MSPSRTRPSRSWRAAMRSTMAARSSSAWASSVVLGGWVTRPPSWSGPARIAQRRVSADCDPSGMRWTVHGETPLYQDEWLDIRLADVELPDGRRLDHRLIRTRPGAGVAMIVDGSVLLLWRHRFITGTWGGEVPLGKADPGEDPSAAAAREAEEETGWRPGPLRPL